MADQDVAKQQPLEFRIDFVEHVTVFPESDYYRKRDEYVLLGEFSVDQASSHYKSEAWSQPAFEMANLT